jgi:hypothetical protein
MISSAPHSTVFSLRLPSLVSCTGRHVAADRHQGGIWSEARAVLLAEMNILRMGSCWNRVILGDANMVEPMLCVAHFVDPRLLATGNNLIRIC